MSVITISRQYGSGGDEIADQLCQLLGYRPFDKRLIYRVAVESGLSEHERLDYNEDSHKVKSFMDRLLARSYTVAQVRVWHEEPNGVRTAETINLDEESALTLVQRAVKAAYEAGNMVILGRGGQMILRDKPDVLHVRIVAPMEDRIQRVKAQIKSEKQEYLADIDTRREAQEHILAHDEASADYIKAYYNEDWADPGLYHLVLNTGMIDFERAAQIIADTMKLLEPQHV